MNKIIAVVKFNDHEAYVLEKPINLKYTKYFNHTIVGTDGIFLSCYCYDSPSPNWKAFAGREFDIQLTDGTIEHCNGQWWDGITSTAKSVINEEIIGVTADDAESLKKCYVFTGYYGIKKEIEKIRAEYNGKIFEYREYEKVLKGDK